MKLITTIVRPERLPEVKAALFQAGVTGITLSRVSGHGGEQEIVSQYRGTTVVMEFHEKVKIEMVCSEPFVEPCIKAILSSARTGEERMALMHGSTNGSEHTISILTFSWNSMTTVVPRY